MYLLHYTQNVSPAIIPERRSSELLTLQLRPHGAFQILPLFARSWFTSRSFAAFSSVSMGIDFGFSSSPAFSMVAWQKKLLPRCSRSSAEIRSEND